MALVFFLTFTVGDWIKGYFEHTIDALSLLAGRGMVCHGVADIVQSLVIDGVIGGVGTIVTFLPNIFILFLALAWITRRLLSPLDEIQRGVGGVLYLRQRGADAAGRDAPHRTVRGGAGF